jgi:amino acid efflux transporter
MKKKTVLKLPQIIALYIGAVLGSGILIIPGIAAEISGPASLIAWGMMAILVLPLSLTMAFLSEKFPNAGGVSYFVTKAFNSHLGSLIGWYFTMAVVIGAPVLILTGAEYLSTAMGLSDSWRLMIAIITLLFSLLVNYFGMKITGWIQITVVLTTLTVLITTIIISIFKLDSINFTPFMPNGWSSVGSASITLFWCFIGWEAVSNMSGEFEKAKRNAVRGTIIAAIIISIIYFMTALVIVGTHSYGSAISDASLVYIIRNAFGTIGAKIAGIAALFICIAPTVAYIGAISRLICSLSETGYAPKQLSYLSAKYGTPLGGLFFLTACSTILLVLISTRVVSMPTLIQIPCTAFILTYIGGCAAGIKLLKGNRLGVFVSIVSLVLCVSILPFVKWTVLYALAITILCIFFILRTKHLRIHKDIENCAGIITATTKKNRFVKSSG